MLTLQRTALVAGSVSMWQSTALVHISALGSLLEAVTQPHVPL